MNGTILWIALHFVRRIFGDTWIKAHADYKSFCKNLALFILAFIFAFPQIVCQAVSTQSCILALAT